MTLSGLRLHCYSNLAYSGEASWGVENSCLCSEILLVHHLGEYPGYLMVGDPPGLWLSCYCTVLRSLLEPVVWGVEYLRSTIVRVEVSAHCV